MAPKAMQKVRPLVDPSLGPQPLKHGSKRLLHQQICLCVQLGICKVFKFHAGPMFRVFVIHRKRVGRYIMWMEKAIRGMQGHMMAPQYQIR
mmetsp:Transcript_23451/g.65480  ORF Transcript_23451/g.65480 Transcript_23451/m.65480 type:complete len:91 (+) Transcript_23451:379-651(+)